MLVLVIKYVFIGLSLVKVAVAQTDPTNIVCTAVNSTTLQLTWTQATDPSVLGYFLHIERVDGIKIEPDIPSVDLNSKTFDTYDFAGLGNYGTYNITIHSYTSSSNLTEYVSTCTTDEDIPDGSPLTFDCTGSSPYALTCSWNSLGLAYWNGIPLGYRLQWLSANVSALNEKTVDSNITTTVIDRLLYGTKYLIFLNPYTSVGHGTLYSTDVASTQGTAEVQEENKTRYFCNEAVPGMIEFGWEEMPCTIYAGTIGGLFVICGSFICIISCQACCGRSASNNISLGFFGGADTPRRKRRDDGDFDDDDDDDDQCDNHSDNDGNMMEDMEDYDDDGHDNNGYANKGYRSDEEIEEDMTSPDERQTLTPDEFTKAPLDQMSVPNEKHPTNKTNDGARVATVTEKALTNDGRVTATEIELEAIGEEVDDTDEMPDSDYDTQSESELDDFSAGIDVGNKGGKCIDALARMSEPSTDTKMMNTTGIVNNKLKDKQNKVQASSKVEINSKQKSNNARPTSVYSKSCANNVTKLPNMSSQTPLKVPGNSKHKSNNAIPTLAEDDLWDDNVTRIVSPGEELHDEIELQSWNTKTKNGTLMSKSMNENCFRKESVVSPFDEWGLDDDNDKNTEIRVKPNQEEKIVTTAKYPSNGNMVQSNVITRNPKAAEQFQKTGVPDAKTENYPELDSWETPVNVGENKVTFEPTKQLLSVTNKGKIQSNGWDDGTGWDEPKSVNRNIAFKNSNASISKEHSGIHNSKPGISVIENRQAPVNITDTSRKNLNKTTERPGSLQSRKQVSFRAEQDTHLKGNKAKIEERKNDHAAKFYIEDEIDQFTISNEQMQTPLSVVEDNGKHVKTQAWLPQKNIESTKVGRHTPVKSIPKAQSWASVEIEPILGTDRLGKRFPFLNVDNTTNDSKIKTNPVEDIRMKKVSSDSVLSSAQRTSDQTKINAVDVVAAFQAPKQNASSNKIFYGFGTGRFRTVAAAWLSKFRAKRNPVKTVQSDWR